MIAGIICCTSGLWAIAKANLPGLRLSYASAVATQPRFFAQFSVANPNPKKCPLKKRKTVESTMLESSTDILLYFKVIIDS
jgi:hypothetical protein